MKIHFTVKYNMEYFTKTSCYCESTGTSCYCEFTGTGCLDISEDEIYFSTFKTAKEWLDYFIEFDDFFNQVNSEDIRWNPIELQTLEKEFKHNQINSDDN